VDTRKWKQNLRTRIAVWCAAAGFAAVLMPSEPPGARAAENPRGEKGETAQLGKWRKFEDRYGGISVAVRRTSYGVPHVLAHDYVDAGYGLGYAFAEDNACEMAGHWLTLNAELSRTFGPDADTSKSGTSNFNSDAFWQRILDDDVIGRLLRLPPPRGPLPEVRQMIRGYVAGYNRYLREVNWKLPDPRCQDATWIRSITERDLYLHALYWSFLGAVRHQIASMVAAAPPATAVRGAAVDVAGGLEDHPSRPSSNMIALGKHATDNGLGMFFANPHWVWAGPLRFYEAHIKIPGKLNVSGMTFMALPVVVVGHNENVAWSHTVSTPGRATIYRLQLSPDSPTAYVFGGQEHEMVPTHVKVKVKRDGGAIEEVAHTFWDTHFGAMIQSASLPWTQTEAYALRFKDANVRWLNQDFLYAKARSVREVHAAAAGTLGWGWLNTTSADSSGEAYYGEVHSVPNISNEKMAACAVNGQILDGVRPECQWDSDPDAIELGLFGPSKLPFLFRDDYTTNSNDSHWTANLRQLLEGYPSILGRERTVRSLRTRIGLHKIEGRLSGTDGLPGNRFSLDQLMEITFNNEVFSGILWRDDLVDLCRSMPATADVAEACSVLANWDLTENLDSPGAVLWRRFMERSGTSSARFRVPFDPADPVYTPRGLDTANPAVGEALVDAVRDLRSSGVPFDATYRRYQSTTKEEERIPIHGGEGAFGQYNHLISSTDGWRPGEGWLNVDEGSSFIMFLQFTGRGPVGRSVLTYSQSTNSESPHFADQTRLFSQKGWKEMLFTEEQIRSDRNMVETKLCATPIQDRDESRAVPCGRRDATDSSGK
jgi:acyl-homoserine-lactone acylase